MIFIILAFVLLSWIIPIYFGFILRKHYKFVGVMTFLSMTFASISVFLQLVYADMVVESDNISLLIDVIFISTYGSAVIITVSFILNAIFMFTNFKNRPKPSKEEPKETPEILEIISDEE